MKKEDANKLVRDLADEDLSVLHDAARIEVRNRQPKVSIDSIKPGMSPEAKAAAFSAIQDALKEL